MTAKNLGLVAAVVQIGLLISSGGWAQDWPQWRGPNRDAKAAGFNVPETWPSELTRKWQVEVGVGVSTPALVGDRLYVFARQGDREVVRCLDAATGEEIWQDSYETEDTEGGASQYPGPRSSPTVADGKVVTFGVRGILSCFDADSGEVLWKDEFQAWPMFFTSTSPIVVDEQCIIHLGGRDGGAIVAYELESGEEKWRWEGDAPGYGSPVVMTVDGTDMIVMPTAMYLVALNAADGRLLMQLKYNEGRYNAGTPIAEGRTLVLAGLGSGLTAVQISKAGDKLVTEELWSNTDNSLQFNTPVLTDGLLFGLSNRDVLFCINAENGETAWTAPVVAAVEASGQDAGQEPRGGRRGRGGRGRRGPRPGFGSIVDAGEVVVVLHPSGQLIVIEPTAEGFKELARYKVAEQGANAYPILSGNRIFIKDQDSVALWTVE